MSSRLHRAALFLLLIPGVLQLGLLCTAMLQRVAYPYDLEWMEGGLLIHAQRIAEGSGIYVDPSVEFIPYLYTPLYPGILAALDALVPIGYVGGRALSILSILIVCTLLVCIIRQSHTSNPSLLSWLGGACAVGYVAATYPFVEGWYDLVRADSLFLAMVVGGLFGLRSWARSEGQGGLAKVACAAALLALSFFAKQTGVIFVATGGVVVLVLNWRRVPLYIAVTGTIGLGGTWLLNRVTGGWFWIYIYKTHQNHDFNMDRFYQSFGNILWQFPELTICIGLALCAVLATAIWRRPVPSAARELGLWTFVYAVAIFVGAIGWGTQFAHFNAYLPAMLFGALCGGLALPATVACIQHWQLRPEGRYANLVGVFLGALLAGGLTASWWSPQTFVPSQAEKKAGDTLIQTIAEIQGEVLIPYHPYYGHLAGKKTYAHLMGLRDMTTGVVWPIRDLKESLKEQRFAAVLMDNRPIGRELSQMQASYRMDDFLPVGASPHVFTGAGAVWNKKVATLIPKSIWVPNRPEVVPDNARSLWNFESGRFVRWRSEKGQTGNRRAWGRRPVAGALPKQGPVRRYGGRYYATSFHGGDKSTGTLTSPEFVVDGSRITFRISGGDDANLLRVELHIDDAIVRIATGNNSERMQEVTWHVAAYEGKTARLVLTDDSTGAWGHLNVDEFWLWQ